MPATQSEDSITSQFKECLRHFEAVKLRAIPSVDGLNTAPSRSGGRRLMIPDTVKKFIEIHPILSALAEDPKPKEDSYDNYSRDFKDGTADLLHIIHFSLDKLETAVEKLRKEDEEILQKKAQYKDEEKEKEEDRRGLRAYVDIIATAVDKIIDLDAEHVIV
jgi:hypothetical protein